MKAIPLFLLLILFAVQTVRAQETTPGEEYDPLAEETLSSPVLADSLPAGALSAPLRAFPDPFAALGDYRFSFLRYRPRGYDARWQSVTLDGIDLGDEFTGQKPWGLMRLLYDTPFDPLRYEGLAWGATNPGLLAGVREYALQPADQPAAGAVGTIFTDRRFRFGGRLHLSSGLMRGWAGTFAGTGRWGDDAHIRGLFADDMAGMVSLEKRWNRKHSITVSGLFASTGQGVRGAATAEAFELTGNSFYNPYWGWQNGSVRSARGRENQNGIALLCWRYAPFEHLKIITTLSFLGGSNAYGGLDRYGADNPFPDYYRYMPSWQGNPAVAEPVRKAWLTGDPRITQIDWARLYGINRLEENIPAVYALGSEVTDLLNFQAASTFFYRRPGQFRLQGGLRARVEREQTYRRLDDLLGAAYLQDIDQFLIDDEYFGDKLQNDLRHPGRQVHEGEAYGYNYYLFHRYYGAWLQVETDGPRGGFAGTPLHAYLGVQGAWRSYSREGLYEKELFPGIASYGPSQWANFTDYLVKGGLDYAFSPEHRLGLEAAYGDQAPLGSQVFLSPAYRNALVGNLRPENFLAGEFRYRVGWRALEVTLTGYAAWRRGGSQVRGYYDDLAGAYVNAVMSGVDQRHAGAELGLLVRLSPRWSLRLAGALAQNVYTADPRLDLYAEKSGEAIAEGIRTYLKGYHPGGSPERLAAAELSYRGRMWMASAALNWAGGNYVMMNPLRRTRRVCDLALAPEIREAFRAQERLGDATTIDLFASKTFRLGKGYLSLNAALNNLANRRTLFYSGYEPWRIARQGSGVNRTLAPFDSRYLYAYGRTYYLTINYRFNR